MANNNDTNETAPGRVLTLENLQFCCKKLIAHGSHEYVPRDEKIACLGYVQDHYGTLDFGTTGDGLGHVGAILAVTKAMKQYLRDPEIQRLGGRALLAVMVPEGFISIPSQAARPVDHSDLDLLRQAIQSEILSKGGYDIFADCFLTVCQGLFEPNKNEDLGSLDPIPTLLLFGTFVREDMIKNAPGCDLTLHNWTQQYFCKQLIALGSGKQVHKQDAVACLGYLQDHYAKVDFVTTGGGPGHVGAILAVTNAMKQFRRDPEIQRSGRSALLAMLVPEAFIPDRFQVARLKDLSDLGEFHEALPSKILQEGGFALFKDCYLTVCFCLNDQLNTQLDTDLAFEDVAPTVLLFATLFYDTDFAQKSGEDKWILVLSSVFRRFIDHVMKSEAVRPLVTSILDALLWTAKNMVTQGNGAGLRLLLTCIQNTSDQGRLCFVAERIRSSGCYSAVYDYMHAMSEVESQLLGCMHFFLTAGAFHPESANELYEIGVFAFIVEQMNGPYSESEKFHELAWRVLGSYLLNESLTITEKSRLIQTLKESVQKFPVLWGKPIFARLKLLARLIEEEH